AAMLGHVLGEQLRGFAFIESLRALLFDALERAREIGLRERVAGFVELAVALEDAFRFREPIEPAPAQRLRETVGNRESLRGELHCGMHEVRPRLLPVLLAREFEAAHRARNARRAVADQAILRGLA